jgi:hypothetical protein
MQKQIRLPEKKILTKLFEILLIRQSPKQGMKFQINNMPNRP